MKKLAHTFEMGPIRPPNEAYSLLIRATRNCPWNKCQFCHLYKNSKFELSPVKEILKDRETARVLNEINADYIRLRSLHVPQGMPLWSKLESGDFEPQTEDKVILKLKDSFI